MFTEKQKVFLWQQKIPLSDVFDATGMGSSEWKAAMRLTGRGFAVNTQACDRGGHTLRTHSGHCIECSTANIGFYQRDRAPGFVYIAGSLNKKQLKIGMTTDLKEREGQLNMYRYGGADDWEMVVYSEKLPNAGNCEFKIHAELKDFRAQAYYSKAGKTYECYEVFKCNLKTALNAFRNALPNGVQFDVPRKDRAMLHYNSSE